MEGIPGGECRLISFKDTGKVFGMYCIASPPVLQLLDIPAEILGEGAVDRFQFAARSHDGNESGYSVNGCSKLRFTRPQSLLGTLALRHIDRTGDRLQKRALRRKELIAG